MQQSHTLDLGALWEAVSATPLEGRLRAFLAAAGVVFFDEEKRFVKKARVALVGIGGLPVSKDFDMAGATKGMVDMMGYGGFFTYMNPKNATPEALVQTMHGLGHYSTAHTAYLNVLVAGASTAVENEFNSQRDIVHLARLTEARAGAQSSPSIVVLAPNMLPTYVRVLEKTEEALRSAPDGAGLSGSEKLDYLEARNALFPAAKATTFLMSGTARNFQKLLGGLMDPGKEDEYRRILAQLADTLSAVLPTVFQPSAALGYVFPKHLSE